MSTIIQKNRWLLKREKHLLILLLALLIAYFVMLFFLDKTFVKQNWFYIALLFESIYLFAKSYFFKSDSSLYLGTLLFLLGIFGFILPNVYYSNTFLLSYLIFSFSISHFFVFCFFKKYAHFYTFIFLFLLFLPMFLYSFNCINLLLMISSICGVVLLTILTGVFVIYGKV